MLGAVVQRCCVRLHGALTTLSIAINSVTNNSKKHYKRRILGREVWLVDIIAPKCNAYSKVRLF